MTRRSRSGETRRLKHCPYHAPQTFVASLRPWISKADHLAPREAQFPRMVPICIVEKYRKHLSELVAA